jgi:hypothetical protein
VDQLVGELRVSRHGLARVDAGTLEHRGAVDELGWVYREYDGDECGDDEFEWECGDGDAVWDSGCAGAGDGGGE